MNSLLILLIPILITIESGGDNNAVGDSGCAIGCLQIHKIMVDDVNRILGKPGYYKYTDRTNREKSIAMAMIYFRHYAPNKIEHLNKTDQLVLMGRIWNGGPRGHHKDATVKYGLKVRKEYHRKFDRMK